MLIPPMTVEIDRVYSQLMAEGQRTLAIVSANPGEGTTSIALSLTQRCLLAGHKTILVDLNLHHPALQASLMLEQPKKSLELLSSPDLVNTQNHDIAVPGITAPSNREHALKLRKPGVLEHCIEQLKHDYDVIIFDTSAINRVNASNIPAERVAAACDGALMVVLSGITSETMVATAIDKLRHGGAQILACIMNDQFNPPLKSEILRQIARLKPRMSKLSTWLEKRISKNTFLSLEV